MILIVGAGIAGLALAIALGRKGIECELVEREPLWTTVGGGITLYPNGIRALRTLGLADAVCEGGAVVETIRSTDRLGRVLGEMPGQVWPGLGPTVAIHRPELQRLLVEAASDVPIRMGTSVAALRVERGGVDVDFADGSSGHFDIVVGADGIRSDLRERFFSPSSPRYVGQMYWRATVLERVVTCATMAFDDDRYVALIPVGGSRVYLGAQLHREAPLDPDGCDPREALEAHFGDYEGPVREAFGLLDDDLHFGPAREIERDEWRAGRVVLVGDAAHACSPTLAQGGSLAIEDAVVLAEVLSSAGAGRTQRAHVLDEALDAFVARREPRARWVRERTHHQIRLLNQGSAHEELEASLEATYAMLRREI
ncbi:MAG: FAD-dependent monooxygenase [Deltaproteobacteria bacterium]|jgi:2-polyprenyl-6-methoxyphenol hydroxylase-like FAD-dependent oxidoreductase|nr:FAD-dependent monooxygenase [Deltaproteobacteria bacterium]